MTRPCLPAWELLAWKWTRKLRQKRSSVRPELPEKISMMLIKQAFRIEVEDDAPFLTLIYGPSYDCAEDDEPVANMPLTHGRGMSTMTRPTT